jgi:hypothetical protein
MVNPGHVVARIQALDESLTRNPAVYRCCVVAQRAVRAVLKEDSDNILQAMWDATNDYYNVMPSLAGHENIRDFIACVAQGMLLGVIDHEEGARLLYAAQVALSALPREPKKPIGRPPKEEK